MVWLALIVPLITAAVLLLLYRTKTCWWEYLLVIGPSIVIIFLLKLIMVSYNTRDTEYLGDHITHVRHYDAWDEWITRTCSYTTCTTSGKTTICTPHYYDCSYRDYHAEYWVKITSAGKEIVINYTEYVKLLRRFGSQEEFVEMNRHYYTIDGDAQQYAWLGGPLEVEAVATEHAYTNKVKASHSVFKFQDISDKEAKEWKLKDYPEVSNYRQPVVIGAYPVPLRVQRKLYYINGVYGPKHQVRVFILLYKNQPYSAVNKQVSYWQGGNKNELLIHIGLDSLTYKMQWYDATSWMDKPEAAAAIKSYLSTQDKFNLDGLTDNLMQVIPHHWHRKNFSDFDYLEVEITPVQLSWLLILLLAYNVGISVWVVRNQYDEIKIC